MIKKCKDCHREVEIEPNIKLVICGCGGLVYDRDEDSSKTIANLSRTKAIIKDNKKSIDNPIVLKKTTGGAYK